MQNETIKEINLPSEKCFLATVYTVVCISLGSIHGEFSSISKLLSLNVGRQDEKRGDHLSKKKIPKNWIAIFNKIIQ